ncbi:acyl-CoA dehydrogenase family protein [Bacillus cereus]|uniref:acyl-CoA dehydrogenase family protein n=1 Tax=Bacillus cereus TaxID=1396 RepID=UPI000944BF05|nr:acyl-CoA dehydrogenase family protein [Bacillus cereus]
MSSSIDVNIINVLKENLKSRNTEYDDCSKFPHKNFDELINNNLHKVTLEQKYGGLGYDIKSTCDLLIEISSACSSTGLILAMHLYSIGGLNGVLSSYQKDNVFRDIALNGELIASISDPKITFLTDKDKIKENISITIEPSDKGYIINGRKRFVSGSSRVKYLPIYGFQEGVKSRYGITSLLTQLDDKGVSIKETWNYSGMKSSVTHDVYFKNVLVPKDRLIGREGLGIEDTLNLLYWFRLTLVSVYYGIAKRAYDYIVQLVKNKVNTLTNKSLISSERLRQKLMEMKINLEVAYSQLTRSAILTDAYLSGTKQVDVKEVNTQILITKQFVTKKANSIVWDAMEIEGMASLSRGSVLEKLYRDVRAATFHPPTEELLIDLLSIYEMNIIPLRR